MALCVTAHHYVTLVKLLPAAGKCDHGPHFCIHHTESCTRRLLEAVICSLQQPENNRVSTWWAGDMMTWSLGDWIESPWHHGCCRKVLSLCHMSYVQNYTCNFDLNLGLFSQSLPIRPANLMSIEMSSQLRCDSLQILHNYPGQWLRVPGYHWPKVINRGLTHHPSAPGLACTRVINWPGLLRQLGQTNQLGRSESVRQN